MKLTINKLVKSMKYSTLIFSFLGILTTGKMEAAAIGAPLAPSATFSVRVGGLMHSYPEVRLECVIYQALQGQSLQAAADTIIDILLSDDFENLLSVSSNFEQWFNDRGDKFKHTVMLASIVVFAGKKDDFVRRINSHFPSWHSTYDYHKFIIYFSALVNVLQANLASGSHYSLVDSLLYPANYQAFLTSIRASAFANEVVDFFMGLFLVSLENTFKNLYHSLGSTNFQGNFAPDFLDFFNRRTQGSQTLSTDPDRVFITLDYLKTLTIAPAMPAAPTAAVAPAAPVLPSSAFTEITLKQTIRNALANNVIRYATPETSWNFTVRGASYTLRKPKGLTPIASDTFDTVVFAIQKLLTIYPGLAAASHIDPNLDEELGVFRQSIKAFDVYCFGTMAHQAIDHAIRTMVDFKIAADSSLATKELANKTHCLGAAGGASISPVAKANLTAIGFPMNHGLGISHMFRPEYELPEMYQGEISYFTRVFNVSDPVRPNYHVEELLYNMARGKAPGSGPKPKDLVEGLSYQYKLWGCPR